MSVIAAAAAGLISFLSPCCLPLLPAYMGYISGLSADELNRLGEKQTRHRLVISRSIAFAIGLILVFVALGASASLIGGWLSEYRALFTRVGGLMVLAFGLHMLGLLHIPLLHREFRPGLDARRGGVLGTMAMGGAFGLGWTPCVGPILGSILVLASQEQTLGQGMLLLLAYGLGLGVPFVLAGLAMDRVLGATVALRRHMGFIEKVGGVLLVAMGLLLVADRLGAIGVWLNGLQ